MWESDCSTQPALLNYRAINNPVEIYDGFQTWEKWEALSGGVSQVELRNMEVSQLMASGPHTIGEGESIEVAFAMIAGISSQDFLQNAEKALEMWDHVINGPTATSVPEVPVECGHQECLTLIRRQGHVTIDFSTAPNSHVRIEVFDVLGRKVAALVEGNRSGTHQSVTWTAQDRDALELASGLYIIRLVASAVDQTHILTHPFFLVRQ